MLPNGQGVGDDRSDEEMEGQKEEDTVPQRNESLLGTESEEGTEAGGKVSEIIEEPTENVEVEKTASLETEVGVREAETELQTTQNVEVEGASSRRSLKPEGGEPSQTCLDLPTQTILPMSCNYTSNMMRPSFSCVTVLDPVNQRSHHFQRMKRGGHFKRNGMRTTHG